MKQKIINLLNNLLALFGLKLGRKSNFIASDVIVDLREFGANISPLQVLKYKSNVKVKYLMRVPIHKICIPEFMLTWIEVLKLYKEEDKTTSTTQRKSFLYLKDFYERYQPKNVAALHDVNLSPKDTLQKEYFDSHPMSIVFPWYEESYTPINRKESLVKNMEKEYKRYIDKDTKYDILEGWRAFGPMSDRNILLDYERLTTTFDSILKEGYDFKYGYIRMGILKKGDDYKHVVLEGWHRTTCLLALNYSSIPVVFYHDNFKESQELIIDFDQKNNWGQVKAGTYSLEQAIEIFDYFFENNTGMYYI